jgi:hypothetical protein
MASLDGTMGPEKPFVGFCSMRMSFHERNVKSEATEAIIERQPKRASD